MPDVETTQGINCSICKNTLFEEESIGFEGARICAACKPGYFQKLREGVMPTQAFRSTFFARLIALCLHGSWCSALAAVITWSALQINPKMPDRVSLPLMVILSAVAAVATLYFCRGRLRTRIWRLPGDLILPAVALFIALFVSGFTGLISLAVYYETNKIKPNNAFEEFVAMFTFVPVTTCLLVIIFLTVIWIISRLRKQGSASH